MNDYFKRNLLFWTLEILVVALIIWVSTKIDFIFQPIATFFSTLFMPIIIAGFLYYALIPLVKQVEKIKIGKFKLNRTLATASVLFLVFLGLGLAIGSIVPKLIVQFEKLLIHIPEYSGVLQDNFKHFMQNDAKKGLFAKINLQGNIKELELSALKASKNFLMSFTSSFGDVIAALKDITVTIVTVPFLLFYMLKDGEKLLPNILKFFPEKSRISMESLLGDMSNTIARYISGQAIECLFVGTFTSIGYGITGVPYALLLGLFAGVVNMIPYLGPYIGLVPALILSMTVSPKVAILAIIVCIVVQQIDGNFIYPNVIGKSLDIHPLTIILLLLVAGNIAGLLGMILGIPAYAIAKVIFKHLREIIRLSQDEEIHND